MVDSLIPTLISSSPQSIILGRSTASPEGPLPNNHRLAVGRHKSVVDFLELKGVNTSHIRFDIVDEEYDLLLEKMREKNDPDYARVKKIVEKGNGNFKTIKANLKRVNKGRLWRRLYKQYYPGLRAVRIMVYDPLPAITFESYKAQVADFSSLTAASIQPKIIGTDMAYQPTPPRLCRREMLSVKTNLLEWVAYVPQYGWCPMPNVAVEYYPKHGHFTYGASFDFPWWIGNTQNHKYFELNNLQLEARYYFRNSDLSYSDAQRTRPALGKAAFKGWYVQANAHLFLYQIGFNAKKGWIGEGYGAGIGGGYMLPISRSEHWRLDFGLQLGLFRTQYDPFVWGKPIYHGGAIDGNYYYNTDRYRDNFVKRQHRYTWLGPTRVGITLSYDLLYRKQHSKRPRFSMWEKGDGR